MNTPHERARQSWRNWDRRELRRELERWPDEKSKHKPRGCVGTLGDVSGMSLLLGLAALLGVALDRLALELAPWVTGGLAAAGALGWFVRWTVLRRA